MEGMSGNQQFVVNLTLALGVAVPSIATAWQTRKIRVHQVLNAKKNNSDNEQIKSIGLQVVDNTNGVIDKLIAKTESDSEQKGESKEKAAQRERDLTDRG